MALHRLDLDDRFLDPFLVQELSRAPAKTQVVNGQVVLGNHRLSFVTPPLPEGTALRVGFNAGLGFWAETEAEIAAAEAAREQQARQAHADEEKRWADRRAADQAFHARYVLPFRWSVGIKDRLSGLSARSQGDGRSRVTVEHLRVLDPFTAGRLSRQAGDFLCTAARGSNGRQWVEPPTVSDPPAVTCPQCLALMARWRRALPTE